MIATPYNTGGLVLLLDNTGSNHGDNKHKRKQSASKPPSQTKRGLNKQDRAMQDLMSLWPSPSVKEEQLPPLSRSSGHSTLFDPNLLASSSASGTNMDKTSRSQDTLFTARTEPTTMTSRSSFSGFRGEEDEGDSDPNREALSLLQAQVALVLEVLRQKIGETDKLIDHTTPFVAARMQSTNKLGAVLSMKKILRFQQEKERLLSVIQQLEEQVVNKLRDDDGCKVSEHQIKLREILREDSNNKSQDSCCRLSQQQEEILVLASEHLKQHRRQKEDGSCSNEKQ